MRTEMTRHLLLVSDSEKYLRIQLFIPRHQKSVSWVPPKKNVQELDKNANEQIFIPEGLFLGVCQQWSYVMEYITRYLEGSRLLIKETKVITYSKLTSD